MKKIIIGIIVLMVIALGVWKYQTHPAEQIASGKPVVKIGAVLPLSGDLSDEGFTAQKALEMELGILNKNNLKYNYELIFEDAQMNAHKTASAANKLINIDNVRGIISMTGFIGGVIIPIAQKKDVFSFSSAWGESMTQGKYNFNIAPCLQDVADLMSQKLIKEGIKNVALITESSGSLIEMKEAMETSFKKYNINIVFNETVLFRTKDFRMMIAKAEEAKPQMYVTLIYAPFPYIFTKQLQELTGKKNVACVDSFGALRPDMRPMVEGLWYVDSNFYGSPEFIKNMKSQTGIDAKISSGALVANLKIFVNALENAPVETGATVPTNEAVVDWIWKNIKEYDSPVGPITVINEGLFRINPVVKMIKNGESIVVDE